MIRFTLWGLYQYDPTLFNNAPVPDGIDKQMLIDTIMDTNGDLYCYYQQPERFKLAITNWFRRHEHGFTRMLLALTKEYNPIENYDRYEDETTTPDIKKSKTSSGSDTNTLGGKDTTQLSGSDTNTLGGKDSTQLSGTDTNTLGGSDTNTLGGKDSTQLSGTDTNTASGSDTVTTDMNETTENVGKVSAFDSSTFENKDHTDNIKDTGGTVDTDYGRTDTTQYGRKDETSYGRTDTTQYGKTDATQYGRKDETSYGRTDTTQYGRKDETSYGRTDTTQYGRTDTETETGKTKREMHIHGQIGVTQYNELIMNEIELRKFDLYKTIALMFEDDLLIQVY